MESSGIIIDLLLLFIACLLSFLLYPLWINFVYRFQMGEQVRLDGPLSHLKKAGTPTMGGLIFVVVTAIVTLFFNRSRTQTLLPIFVASIAGFLGLVEDFTKVYRRSGLPGFFEYHFSRLFRPKSVSEIIKPVPLHLKPFAFFKEFWRIVGSSSESGMQSHHKILLHFLLAGFVSYWVYFKLGWDFIWFPLIGNVHIGFFYPLVVFALFIFVLNMVSITDGLDGLLGGLVFISGLVFWALASLLGYKFLATFCATFIGSMIPFLYFNVYPARVFMGNVGSHFLGAFMVILAIVMHREVGLLFIAFVAIADGVTSPLQQLSVKLTGKRIFRMAPVHHHFEVLGWPEVKVTLRFWILATFFAFFGLFISLL